MVTLAANQQLNIGDQLLASNGTTRLLMQSDGNFVLYNSNNSTAYWNAGTFGHSGASLQFAG